jgi:hypothetical protein
MLYTVPEPADATDPDDKANIDAIVNVAIPISTPGL